MRGNNLTYILGAGASFKAIPLVSELKQLVFIWQFRQKIEGFHAYFKSIPDLIQDSVSYDTIVIEKDRLDMRKESLLLRFYLEQLIIHQHIFRTSNRQPPQQILWKQKLDERYKEWLSRLSNGVGNDRLPSNVTVFTWNYDLQLVFAICDLFDKRPSDIVRNLNSNGYCEVGLKIFPLNGLVTTNSSRMDQIYDMYRMVEGKELSEKYSQYLSEQWERVKIALDNPHKDNAYKPSITFGWQGSAETEFKNEMQKSEHLVIIGYSFHDFNSRTDLSLLSGLEHAERLRTIQLQVGPDDLDEIKESLIARLPITRSLQVRTSKGENVGQPSIHNEDWDKLVSYRKQLSKFHIPTTFKGV